MGCQSNGIIEAVVNTMKRRRKKKWKKERKKRPNHLCRCWWKEVFLALHNLRKVLLTFLTSLLSAIACSKFEYMPEPKTRARAYIYIRWMVVRERWNVVGNSVFFYFVSFRCCCGVGLYARASSRSMEKKVATTSKLCVHERARVAPEWFVWVNQDCHFDGFVVVYEMK